MILKYAKLLNIVLYIEFTAKLRFLLRRAKQKILFLRLNNPSAATVVNLKIIIYR
jgi:hypothetical protein